MVRTANFCLISILLAGCSSRPTIVIGSKNFTEQLVLGEILAQHLEQKLDVRVERKLNLGGTLLAHEALKAGSIDLYPEYTGTALTAVLKQGARGEASAVLGKVREAYRQWRLEWLDPLGFNNTFAMVVRNDGAGITTLSEAARRTEPWRIGAGHEFLQRPDGLNGLVSAYGLRLQGTPVTMDLGLLYQALESQQVDMAAASATDGVLARPNYKVLADDRQYFPPYECAVVIREESAAKYAGLKAALLELSGKISEEEMRRMNAAADTRRESIVDIAGRFLQSIGNSASR